MHRWRASYIHGYICMYICMEIYGYGGQNDYSPLAATPARGKPEHLLMSAVLIWFQAVLIYLIPGCLNLIPGCLNLIPAVLIWFRAVLIWLRLNWYVHVAVCTWHIPMYTYMCTCVYNSYVCIIHIHMHTYIHAHIHAYMHAYR